MSAFRHCAGLELKARIWPLQARKLRLEHEYSFGRRVRKGYTGIDASRSQFVAHDPHWVTGRKRLGDRIPIHRPG